MSGKRASTIAALFALLRPRLLPSACADVLAGWALAGGPDSAGPVRVTLLLVASLLLYGGGMVWNDVADATRDRELGRDTKPIVAGRVTRGAAAGFAAILSLVAVALLGLQGLLLYGLVLLAGILVYDFVGTRVAAVGVLVLPLCRASNVGLGLLVLHPGATMPPGLGEPAIAIPIAAYGLYVACAILHGRLEDRAEPNDLTTSHLVIGAALLFTVLACPFAREPLWAAIACVPIGWSALQFLKGETSGPSRIPARTGLLLRGLSRFSVVVAAGAGSWSLAIACALLAYGVPLLLRRLVAARWT